MLLALCLENVQGLLLVSGNNLVDGPIDFTFVSKNDSYSAGFAEFIY